MRRLLLVALALITPLGMAHAQPQGDVQPDYAKDPVLFVHGYFLGQVGSWTWLKAALADAGWPEEYLMSFQFDSVFGCNPGHAQELKAKADELMATTGRDKIDIVCHSMGCLDSRYYIKHLCGYQHVRDLVSIAGANQGSVLACTEPISCGAEQMCVGPTGDAWMQNAFLKELNWCDMTPGEEIRYTAIWTPLDEIIVPAENCQLDGAVNIKVSSIVGHGLILSSPETLGYVIPALDGSGSNDNMPTAEPPCYDVCAPQTAEGEDAGSAEDVLSGDALTADVVLDAASGPDVVSPDAPAPDCSSPDAQGPDITAGEANSQDNGAPDVPVDAGSPDAGQESRSATELDATGLSDPGPLADAGAGLDAEIHVIPQKSSSGCASSDRPVRVTPLPLAVVLALLLALVAIRATSPGARSCRGSRPSREA